jgi:hypothetical protein
VAFRFSGKVANLKVPAIPEPLRERANPVGRFTSGLLPGASQESLDLCTKVILRGLFFARVSKISRLPSGSAADPRQDGLAWEPRSKPSRIELDFDLLKSNRRDRVAMSGSGAIEDRGRTGDELRPDFRLVQIGAHHEE